jgi:hypothetical protein
VKISEVSKYRVVRERVTAIIDILADEPDYTLHDKSGLLNRRVIKMLPAHLKVSRIGGKPITTGGLWGTLKIMEDAGWIKTEVNGKRTFKIMLVDFPDDWQLTGDMTEVSTEEVDPFVEADPVVTVEDDGLDGRPGRLAARLEKNIPDLVEQGVTNAIFSIVSKMFPQVVPEVDTTELDKLHDIIEALNHDLSAEKLASQVTRENYNAAMRKAGAVYETSPVRPHQLEKAIQPLAKHAIDHGWTIHRTNNGHIMFRSPDGKPYFHGSTSSDTRSVNNAASDMYRMGLAKMP